MRTSSVCIVMSLATACAPAMADLTLEPVGLPVGGNSWSQSWIISAPTIDLIGVRINREFDGFKDPDGFGSLNDLISGWSETRTSSTVSAIAGTEVTPSNLDPATFTTTFFGDVPTLGDSSFSVEVVYFHGQDLVGALGRVWFPFGGPDGMWGASFNSDWSPRRNGNLLITPVPAGALLAALGLGLVGIVRRRRIR